MWSDPNPILHPTVYALKAYLRAVERFDVRPEVPVLVKDLKAATNLCLHFGRHDVIEVDAMRVAA